MGNVVRIPHTFAFINPINIISYSGEVILFLPSFIILKVISLVKVELAAKFGYDLGTATIGSRQFYKILSKID
jgi:hypothetical protein